MLIIALLLAESAKVRPLTKIKSHGDEVTDFYDKEIPKVDSNHTCSAIISLNSDFKKKIGIIILKCF